MEEKLRDMNYPFIFISHIIAVKVSFLNFVVMLSVIVAKYLPFLQLHVAVFQI